MTLASCRTHDHLDGVCGPQQASSVHTGVRGRVPARVWIVLAGNVKRALGMGAERNTLDKSWNHSSQYGHVLSRSVRHVTLRVQHAVQLGSQPRTRHLPSNCDSERVACAYPAPGGVTGRSWVGSDTSAASWVRLMPEDTAHATAAFTDANCRGRSLNTVCVPRETHNPHGGSG
jgi:hypothetical protein